MQKRITSIIIALMFLLLPIKTVAAQGDVDYPVYIVQSGENLTQIAEKFGVTVNELILANNITDYNLISEGTQLIIPGIEGVNGVLNTTPVEFGENLTTILRRNKISKENFMRLNTVTSPSELYIGANLILPESNDEGQFNNSIVVGSRDSMLENAVRNNINPWYLAKTNQISGQRVVANDMLFYYSPDKEEFQSPISDLISKIELDPLPIVQGHTAEVRVYAASPVALTGSMAGYNLNFFQDNVDQFYYALQGIHALATPGLVPLKINGQFENGQSFSVEQMILLQSGNYPNENLTVESTKIEKSIIETDNQINAEILSPISPDKLWNGSFAFPVDGSLDDNTMGFSSYFGSRRSYNDGEYYGFHGGLDFLVVVYSFNVYAPAPGIIAYTGTQDIRGNTIFIDHGQGIYSGYAHLKEIQVNVGDRVETGQLIAQIGATGRVTGPHLHWDIFVNGNAVDPFDWIDNSYP